MFNVYTKYVQYLKIFVEYLHNTWPTYISNIKIIYNCIFKIFVNIFAIFVQYLSNYMYNIWKGFVEYLHNICTVFV